MDKDILAKFNLVCASAYVPYHFTLSFDDKGVYFTFSNDHRADDVNFFVIGKIYDKIVKNYYYFAAVFKKYGSESQEYEETCANIRNNIDYILLRIYYDYQYGDYDTAEIMTAK